MAFMDRFKKGYIVKARCYNCGHTMDLKVPKGITIDSYLKTEGAMCENCGNPTLRRIMNSPVQAPAYARAPILQQRKPQPTLPRLPPIPQLNEAQKRKLQQSRMRERQHPQYRQQLPPEEYQQEVEYPVDEPIQEDGPDQNWNSRPKKINFWTGKDE